MKIFCETTKCTSIQRGFVNNKVENSNNLIEMLVYNFKRFVYAVIKNILVIMSRYFWLLTVVTYLLLLVTCSYILLVLVTPLYVLVNFSYFCLLLVTLCYLLVNFGYFSSYFLATFCYLRFTSVYCS